MVKQAVKIRKRNPLLPIFGLIIALGLALVAWFIADLLIDNVPQLKANFGGTGQTATIGHIAIAAAAWFIMVAITYFLVALLAGKDPDDARHVPLPPREVKKKK